MVLYSYVCRRMVYDGMFPMEELHEISDFYEMGRAPDTVRCPEHDLECFRDFGALQINPSNDEFRRYHLSGEKSKAEVHQQRKIAAGPTDKFEAKHIEEKTGRIYVGNDSSRLSEKGQRALAKGEQKKYAYQNGGALHDG